MAASTQTDARARYSNFGPCVDLFAPGDGIESTWNRTTSAHQFMSGTSMASAHVTGVAALYLEAHPTASVSDLVTALKNNATAGVITDSQSEQDRLLNSGFAAIPAAPSVSATAGYRSAQVSWNTPSDGGSPITGYRVAAYPERLNDPGRDADLRRTRVAILDRRWVGRQCVVQLHSAGGERTRIRAPWHIRHRYDTGIHRQPGPRHREPWLDPADHHRRDQGEVHRKIRNIGSVDTQEGVQHAVKFFVDGTQVAVSTSFTGPLPAGGETTVKADLPPVRLRAGDHELRGSSTPASSSSRRTTA